MPLILLSKEANVTLFESGQSTFIYAGNGTKLNLECGESISFDSITLRKDCKSEWSTIAKLTDDIAKKRCKGSSGFEGLHCYFAFQRFDEIAACSTLAASIDINLRGNDLTKFDCVLKNTKYIDLTDNLIMDINGGVINSPNLNRLEIGKNHINTIDLTTIRKSIGFNAPAALNILLPKGRNITVFIKPYWNGTIITTGPRNVTCNDVLKVGSTTLTFRCGRPNGGRNTISSVFILTLAIWFVSINI